MASASIVERARHEWRRFKDDEPGRRFRHYRTRLHQHGSRALRILGIAAGLLFILAGIAMCFLPGPGAVTILLGLAMLGGESRRLAAWLDRLEPWLRRRASAARRWWKRRSLFSRVALVALAMLATGLAMRAWWTFFGPG
ncbi:MAG TPA: PGPGW domain-containing protein [Kofleriaceae bacterium]|jgi:uncharacterized membrane protein YbaN (DUF454 family)